MTSISPYVIYGLKLIGDGEPIRYVGQTRRGISTRFSQHLHSARNAKSFPVSRWIAKYNFNVEYIILEELSNPEFLNDREIFWISFYKTTIDANGYNLSPGGASGASGCSWTLSDIARENQSNGRRKYIKENPEVLQNMSENMTKWHSNSDNKRKHKEGIRKAYLKPENKDMLFC